MLLRNRFFDERKLEIYEVISIYPELEDDIREILILEGQDGLLEK